MLASPRCRGVGLSADFCSGKTHFWKCWHCLCGFLSEITCVLKRKQAKTWEVVWKWKLFVKSLFWKGKRKFCMRYPLFYMLLIFGNMFVQTEDRNHQNQIIWLESSEILISMCKNSDQKHPRRCLERMSLVDRVFDTFWGGFVGKI